MSRQREDVALRLSCVTVCGMGVGVVSVMVGIGDGEVRVGGESSWGAWNWE